MGMYDHIPLIVPEINIEQLNASDHIIETPIIYHKVWHCILHKAFDVSVLSYQLSIVTGMV